MQLLCKLTYPHKRHMLGLFQVSECHAIQPVSSIYEHCSQTCSNQLQDHRECQVCVIADTWSRHIVEIQYVTEVKQYFRKLLSIINRPKKKPSGDKKKCKSMFFHHSCSSRGFCVSMVWQTESTCACLMMCLLGEVSSPLLGGWNDLFHLYGERSRITRYTVQELCRRKYSSQWVNTLDTNSGRYRWTLHPTKKKSFLQLRFCTVIYCWLDATIWQTICC